MAPIVDWGRFAQYMVAKPFFICESTPTPIKVTVYRTPDWRTSRDMYNAIREEYYAQKLESKPEPVQPNPTTAPKNESYQILEPKIGNIAGTVVQNMINTACTASVVALSMVCDTFFKYRSQYTIRFSAKETDRLYGAYMERSKAYMFLIADEQIDSNDIARERMRQVYMSWRDILTQKSA